MRFIATALICAIILFLCPGPNAYSAGLEKYPPDLPKNTKQSKKSVKAPEPSELNSFLKKGIGCLDGVALTVKDILHQLGITKNSR
jgi:hypothetical protein